MNINQDEFFKDKYIAALGEDLEIQVNEYVYKNFSGLEVDNKIILEIHSMEVHLQNSEIIDIKNSSNINIGYIDIAKNKKIEDYNELNANRILYIWNHYRKTGDRLTKFPSHFMVIEKDFFEDYYDNHFKTSSLWGGFKHEIMQISSYKPISELIIPENPILFPTQTNEATSNSSTYTNNIYDIFLKKYHQLELVFNLIFVKQLQNLDDFNDLKNINNIYKNMNKDEIDSIIYLFSNFCSENQKVKLLKIIMFGFDNYTNVFNELLFEYGKDSNPIKTEDLKIKFLNFIQRCNQENPSNLSSYRQISKEIKFKTTVLEFDTFLSKLICYVIYRIRCSIAHSKLSEFIFSLDEEHLNFMTDIALPLITETVIDIFSNLDFNNLFTVRTAPGAT